MPLEIREDTLPGIGKRYEIDHDGEINSTISDDFAFEPEDQLIYIGLDGTHRELSAFVYGG